MEIWLRHEAHGIKCAHLTTEAESDEKNGWVRFDPFARDEKSAVETLSAAQGADSEPEESSESTKKRGRPAKNQG
jgi:hypothetical protein